MRVVVATSLFDYFLGDLGVNYAWQPLTNFGRCVFSTGLDYVDHVSQMEEKFNYTLININAARDFMYTHN